MGCIKGGDLVKYLATYMLIYKANTIYINYNTNVQICDPFWCCIIITVTTNQITLTLFSQTLSVTKQLFFQILYIFSIVPYVVS